MTKKLISKYFILVSLTTFISIFALMVHNSYQKLITPTKQVQESNLTKTINPVLDIATLQILEQKTEYSPPSP